MATVDAGARVTCPACGGAILQKAMIPMVAEAGQGVRYVCNDCARKDVVVRVEAGTGAEPSGAEDPPGPAVG